RNTSRPLTVPVYRECRILWVIEPESAIYRQLAATQSLHGGKYVFYTDITPASQPFMVDEFEIVPALYGFLPAQVKSLTALAQYPWTSTTSVFNTNPCAMRSTRLSEGFSVVAGTFSVPQCPGSKRLSPDIAARRMRLQ